MHDGKKNELSNPFSEWMKPFNQFFNDKPVKGFLQQIDELFQAPMFTASSFNVNVTESDKDYRITAELPGVNREQIDIDIYDRYVTISVQSTESITEEDENRAVVRRQQSTQRSIRTVPLPHPINEKQVKASYHDGLLEITVPKQKGKKIYLD